MQAWCTDIIHTCVFGKPCACERVCAHMRSWCRRPDSAAQAGVIIEFAYAYSLSAKRVNLHPHPHIRTPHPHPQNQPFTRAAQMASPGVTSRHAMSCHIILYRITAYNIVSRHIIPCHIILYHVTSCYKMSHHIMTSYHAAPVS